MQTLACFLRMARIAPLLLAAAIGACTPVAQFDANEAFPTAADAVPALSPTPPLPDAPPASPPIAPAIPSPSPGPSPTSAKVASAVPVRPSDARFPGCTGSGSVPFVVSPMREEDILHLLPYGMLAGAHVTPIDHMYFEPLDRSLGRDVYEVRVVQDGVIYSLQPRDISVDTGTAKAREWRMDIAHSCTFTTYFDLLTSIDPAIEAVWSETQGGRTGPWTGVPVKAGQVVGRIGTQTLDFGTYDYDTTLPGYVVPAHYDREPWKVHTVDPFPFFPENVRDMLLSKMLRQAGPRAGKIDQDVDGTLAGNWFQTGTGGYAGTNPSKYWDGHLALVRDGLDPTQWRFSIGNFGGRAMQFGIENNGPDPETITPDSGLVTYELVQYDYLTRNDPSRHGLGPGGLEPGDDVYAANFEQVMGVALIQMIGPRVIRCEVFPGKTRGEVAGFTSAVREFER